MVVSPLAGGGRALRVQQATGQREREIGQLDVVAAGLDWGVRGAMAARRRKAQRASDAGESDIAGWLLRGCRAARRARAIRPNLQNQNHSARPPLAGCPGWGRTAGPRRRRKPGDGFHSQPSPPHTSTNLLVNDRRAVERGQRGGQPLAQVGKHHLAVSGRAARVPGKERMDVLGAADKSRQELW